MKLYELPNGAWVDPTTISAVLPFNATECLADRVTVVYGNGSAFTSIQFKSWDEAVKFAAELSKIVNDRWREGIERLEVK